MSSAAPTLIIPVENQVREMDAKLLLACVAAERGFPVIIGSRAYVHFQAASIPPGVYIAKSMRGMSAPMFYILRKLGHDIVAWEEEALVHPPAEIFFKLRLSAASVKFLSEVFAWGPEYAGLLRSYPDLPRETPIHITGNPRGDLLRPELRAYFDPEVARLRGAYGNFILVNTNFSDVNPFIPSVGLFLPSKDPRKPARFGQAGRGMSREFAEGLRDHRQAVLDDFRRLIPALEQAFPDLAIVVRPHPSEHLALYQELAARCRRVRVCNEGNVLPWLLASKALVHNGCTTGVEAYGLGVPAVAYLATLDRYYDYDFQGLPNRLSYACRDLESLRDTLAAILGATLGPADDEERRALMDHYVAARTGAFACERIVDILHARGGRPAGAAGAVDRAQGRLLAKLRSTLVQLNMRRPGPNRLAYHDHRFPEISVAEIQSRIARFSRLLNRFEGVRVRAHSRHLFRIDA